MLTSPRNPKIVAVTRLHKRTFREQERRFLIEGHRSVSEALARPGRITQLFVCDELDPLAIRARQDDVDVETVSEDVMHKLASTVTPQGILGVGPFVDVSLDDLAAEGCLAILHEVRDPGNAGTLLRSADASGATGVVVSSTSVDVYNPKTVRATAGSLFHVAIAREVDTAEAVRSLQAKGVRVLAMAADGTQDLYRADLTGPVAFLFGNEAHGLPDELVALADGSVRIPQPGSAESLNLAAAGTVCLFERARRVARESEALETMIVAAAHDLRSPLTAMKGFGYALEKRSAQMSEEQRAMMLRGIVHDADRMDTILRLLLDAARVVGGTLEVFREQVSVPDLVTGVADAQRRDPDHPAIEWVGPPTMTPVFADPARLKTAILAFTESLVWWAREGPVRVDAAGAGNVLRLWASRDGTELDTEGAEALFVPRRPGEGAGSKIGLFVTRGVVEAQGGRVWSAVDDGVLSFHLELPVGI